MDRRAFLKQIITGVVTLAVPGSLADTANLASYNHHVSSNNVSYILLPYKARINWAEAVIHCPYIPFNVTRTSVVPKIREMHPNAKITEIINYE